MCGDRGWPGWGHDIQANTLPATGHRAHWPVVTLSGNYRNIGRVGLPGNPEPVSYNGVIQSYQLLQYSRAWKVCGKSDVNISKVLAEFLPLY